MDLATALQETATWPLEDQLELVQRVWDRLLDSGWQPELTAEQKAVIDRRLAEHEARPEDATPWEEVRAQALARARQ